MFDTSMPAEERMGGERRIIGSTRRNERSTLNLPNIRPQQSKQSRNKANTRRNSAQVEQYLTEIEKAHGFAKSWQLRERLEQGDVTLEELKRR